MKYSTITRHIREGGKNVVRNGWMTFASTSAIAISLFILGVFMILAFNVNHLADQIESQVEIRVYIAVNTAQDQIDELKGDLTRMPEVNTVKFVSKQEGMDYLRTKLGKEGGDLLNGFDGSDNPLPDSFTVEVKDPKIVGTVADKILKLNDTRTTPVIDKINYGKGTVETMFKVTRIVRNIGLVMVGLLTLTAMFLISNTIKITIIARRREIAIMKLVGATNSFIRWPFFIEGAILGLMGSIIPVVAILYGYAQLVSSSKFQLGLMMVQLKPLNEIMYPITELLLGIGIIIGVWGSTISIRKFLKV